MAGKKTTKKKEKGLNPEDTFFLAFVGELVEVAGSFYHGDQEAAIKISGYILDVDDEYYYLGDNPEEITHAIRRERVIYLQVLNDSNQYTQILDSLEVPKDESQKN